MRFVVIGAGAIGGVVGGSLARAGADVVLVARGAHGEAIAAHGLRVESPDGAFVVRPPLGVPAWRDDDVVLLAVKTQDVEAALHAVPAQVPIVCLTNGIAAERIAAARCAHVFGAMLVLPASHLVPGVVQCFGSPPGVIHVGRYPQGAPLAIVDPLRGAGFVAEARDDVMHDKRGKLLVNLANVIEMLCGPEARRSAVAGRARAEGVACFAAAQLTYAEELPHVALVGGARPGGSMWQSLARGRSLEVDHLNGEIVALGRAHGVPTPVNAALVRIAATATTPGSMTIDALERAVNPA